MPDAWPGQPGFDISVIIPTYNRPGQLAACLKSLVGQDFPRERFEVLVSDDAGVVDLDAIATEFEVQVVRLPENAGPGAARNFAASIAKGKLLAFTDDDCMPEPGWLTAFWHKHCDTPTAMLGGRIVNALPRNVCAEASQVISDMVYAHYNATPDASAFFSSNNIAVPRGRFMDMGGFDSGFRVASEDREFCDRWRHEGGQLVLVTAAVVRHAHDLSLKSFARQHFAYGRGAYRYHQLRSARGSGRMSQDMSFHLGLPGNLRRRLANTRVTRTLSLIGLLATWQMVNAAGFFYEKLKP